MVESSSIPKPTDDDFVEKTLVMRFLLPVKNGKVILDADGVNFILNEMYKPDGLRYFEISRNREIVTALKYPPPEPLLKDGYFFYVTEPDPDSRGVMRGEIVPQPPDCRRCSD